MLGYPHGENCPVQGCLSLKGHESFGPEDGWHLSINGTSFRDPADSFTAAIEYAEAEGKRDGEAAASWYFDGNTPDSVYTRTLVGIEDGDPEVLEALPQPDLSGQFADVRTGPDLYAEAMIESGLSPDPEIGDNFTAICDAYEMAFFRAVEDSIGAAARAHLAE